MEKDEIINDENPGKEKLEENLSNENSIDVTPSPREYMHAFKPVGSKSKTKTIQRPSSAYLRTYILDESIDDDLRNNRMALESESKKSINKKATVIQQINETTMIHGIVPTRPSSAPSQRPKRFTTVTVNASEDIIDGPALSNNYLKEAAIKRNLIRQRFQEEIAEFQKEQLKRYTKLVNEVNKLLANEGNTKSYVLIQDKGEFSIQYTQDNKIYTIPTDSLERELNRLQMRHMKITMQKQKDGNKNTVIKSSSSSIHTHSNRKQMEKSTSVKMSQEQIQNELKSILQNTIELSAVLTEQIEELKRKGWNVTGMQQQVLWEVKRNTKESSDVV